MSKKKLVVIIDTTTSSLKVSVMNNSNEEYDLEVFETDKKWNKRRTFYKSSSFRKREWSDQYYKIMSNHEDKVQRSTLTEEKKKMKRERRKDLKMESMSKALPKRVDFTSIRLVEVLKENTSNSFSENGVYRYLCISKHKKKKRGLLIVLKGRKLNLKEGNLYALRFDDFTFSLLHKDNNSWRNTKFSEINHNILDIKEATEEDIVNYLL